MAQYSVELRIVRDLLRAGLDETPFTIGTDVIHWQGILQCLAAHQILPIAWIGCKHARDPENIPREVRHTLEREYQMSAGWDTCQYFAFEKLRQAFQMEKIAYIPLKGILLKEGYPQPQMRNMSDLDLLFRPEQFDQIRAVLERAGCRFTRREAVDESYFLEPVVHIEAHWDLLEGEGPSATYFRRIWERVYTEGENRYEYKMSWEDYYGYMIAHAAKHFVNCGTGLRNLADIHVFLHWHAKDLDWSKMQALLRELGLDRFEQRMRALQQVFFSQADIIPEEQMQILQYMVQAGAYGKWENGKLNLAVKTTHKRDVIRKLLFPAREVLCQKYPALCARPFGMGIAWIRYIMQYLGELPHTIRRIKCLMRLDQQKLRQQQNLLCIVGLDRSF